MMLLGALMACHAARISSEAELTARQLRALQTTFSQHLEKTAEAAASKDDKEKATDRRADHNKGPLDDYHSGEHEQYYEPEKTEIICLKEESRRQCSVFGGRVGGPPGSD